MLKALQEVGASPGQMPRALTRSELETFGLWQLIEPQKTADPCPADESAGQLASRADAAATQCDPLSTPDIDSPTIAKEALVDRARTAAAADADPFPEMPAWQCLNESLAELIGSSGFAAPSTVATVPESEAIVAVTDVAECVIPAELAEHPAPPPLHTVGPPKPAAEPLASTPCQARPAESLPSAPGPTRIGEPGKQDRARYLELADRVLARVPLRRPASLVFTGTDCEHVTAAMLADLAVALTDRLPGEVLVVDADFESPR
ncbi:MAG: hypothetical protein HUU20_19300, partial [Pirellulales bacterium]|nr:hypothetical protein [Pirellulales bacterium]